MFVCHYVDDDAVEYFACAVNMTLAFEMMQELTPDREIDIDTQSEYIQFFRLVPHYTQVKTVFCELNASEETLNLD